MNPRASETVASFNEPHYVLQLVLLLAFLILAILFLLTEQNTLKRIKPENRSMRPGLVWLQIIPLFGQVWQFVVVSRIAKSIGRQIQNVNEDSVLGFADASSFESSGRKPTLVIGLTYCTLDVLIILNNLFKSPEQSPTMLLVISLIAVASVICWVVYWISLAIWSSKLKRTSVSA
jgi:quinol-cytochrome oxidoreductase complex cytochrome b subunit